MIDALLAGAPLLPAAMVAINRLTWRRASPGGRFEGRVSVLIPARNEALNIEACVEAVYASDLRVAEVIVYDDASTDATPAILLRLAARHRSLRVLRGTGLPAGWVGKPHACHQLARAARGDVLLYLDADVRIARDGLSRLARELAPGIDVVSALPAQEMGSLGERLLLPLLHLTYAAWLPLGLVARLRSPAVLAANGQVLAVRRSMYERMGGFAAVRAEVVDDMAFCRQVKRAGGVVAFVDGARIARCRMYRSAAEVVEGFSKNLYEGLGGSVLALAAVSALYVACFVLPYVGLLIPGVRVFAAVGVGLNVLLRMVLAARFGHTPLAVVLHPLAVLGMLAIGVRSSLWSRRGAITWRGRVYAARIERGAA